MAGWRRVVAGVVIGVAGTIYATNEDVRKRLPAAARDLPENVRGRFKQARTAAREASARRREEILHDLEEHGGGHHSTRGAPPDPDAGEVALQTPDEQTKAVPEVLEEVPEQS